jgi:hypothetical protein
MVVGVEGGWKLFQVVGVEGDRKLYRVVEVALRL